MPSSLAIGDFSRATHLTIKTLRHYHRIGLLEPADVDPATGHRRYGTDQIPAAQVIKRFRSLGMPLEEIHAVITTPDLAARNELIAGHLRRLEMTLARTQEAAASLRDLLQPPAGAAPVAIEHRRVPASPAAAVSEVIDVQDASGWYQGALGELHALLAAQKVTPAGSTPVAIELRRIPATPAAAVSEVIHVKEASAWYQGALGELYAVLAAHKVTPAGPGGAIYASDLFSHTRGQATVFVPCNQTIRATGRVTALVVPEAELAVTTHAGAHNDVDLAYGSLAAYVTDHALGVEGPIREYYLIGPHETTDENQWRTEIGWPIFHTGQTGSRPPGGHD